MLPKELQDRLQEIDGLVSYRLSKGLRIGEHRSRKTGSGLDFINIREYEPGDDLHQIDWRASAARTTDDAPLLVKEFVEPKEVLTVMVADLSRSILFGSSPLKSYFLMELLGAIAFTSSHLGDAVGCVGFDQEVCLSLKPRGGKNQVYYLLEQLWEKLEQGSKKFQPQTTDLNAALRQIEQQSRRPCFLPIVSDFLGGAHAVDRAVLKSLALRHDLIAFRPVVPEEENFKRRYGFIKIRDVETGQTVRLSQKDLVVVMAELNKQKEALQKDVIGLGGDWIDLPWDTEKKYLDRLVEKFLERRILR
ncbi:MAG: DUF58 domain-containing protein [bacterium]|nr:DUF58 domain-containing protein [bacterium]